HAGAAFHGVARALLNEAGQHDRTARRHFQRFLGAAYLQRRDGNAADDGGGAILVADRRIAGRNRAFAGELADFGRDLERNVAARHNDRRKGEADAERLELDRNLAVVAVDRHWEFAAGEEAGVFTRDRRQVRLGENAQQTGALERFDRCVRAAGTLNVRGAERFLRDGRVELVAADAGVARANVRIDRADGVGEAIGTQD